VVQVADRQEVETQFCDHGVDSYDDPVSRERRPVVEIVAAMQQQPGDDDHVLTSMGGSFLALDCQDLFVYFKRRFEETHGYTYVCTKNRIKETVIFRSFVAHWGINTAGLIVRAAFEYHAGMWNREPIMAGFFSPRMLWAQDLLHHEVMARQGQPVVTSIGLDGDCI
jgi:hypothetical protein